MDARLLTAKRGVQVMVPLNRSLLGPERRFTAALVGNGDDEDALASASRPPRCQ